MSEGFEITVPTTMKVAYLQADCGVRYWEDATVNGVVDEDGTLIPCRVGDGWRPLIDLKMGTIADWPPGTEANIHYKVCDAGTYALLDADRDQVIRINSYVPKMMSPGGEGYGDYVIMKIGPDGKIENWRADLSDFDQQS